ncbi:MAG: TonB-dependent receptor [Gemmatimonadota bacterium]|nr:TonB-dependent receptor [Gemmatimonadota bacterium]
MTTSRRLLLAIALFTTLPRVTAAQDVTGHLEGRVTGPDSLPLPAVEVIVEGTGLPGMRLTRADNRGQYRVEALPVGTYQVRLRLIGYRPVVLSGIGIRLGRTATVPTVALEVLTAVLEELQVTAERPLFDPASAAGGGNLVADQFDELPIERSYRTLPALLPGVNLEQEGLNIEGATGLENQYFIDGANVTDMNSGIASTILPPDFVQEVQVRTGGYEAEYRGALGGNINVVTRSGGDRLRVQVFGYSVTNRLTAEPSAVPGNTATGDFSRYDGGASVGGPLVRERLWFFGAYNHSVEREENLVPGFGNYDAERTRNSFAAKLTWQPGPRTTILTSVIGDPTSETPVGSHNGGLLNPDPLLGRGQTGGVAVSVIGTHTVNPRLLLKGTASWVRQADQLAAATARGASEDWYLDSSNVLSGGYSDDKDVINQRLTAGLSASYAAGAHQLKAGLELAEHRLTQSWVTRQVFQERPTGYTLLLFDQFGSIKSRLPSAFLQDAWTVGRHLTLNAGLRWDGQYLFGSDGHLSLAIKDQWQPRIGVVMRPDAEGRQRLFASYGRFYQDLHQSLGSLYYAYGSAFAFRSCPQDPRVDSTGCDPQPPGFTRVPDPGLEGQSFDEWSVGYERGLFRRVTARLRAVHRRVRWGIEDGESVSGTDTSFVVGNPGRGSLGNYPKMRREYTALEFGLEGPLTDRLWVLASYVWSQTYGNHSGLYNSDEGYVFPNVNGAYDIPEILVNGTGRLGNDRPHVFKLNGAYRFPAGLSAGSSLVWQSGTPLNVLGAIPNREGFYHAFLQPRGTAGRTPATWDLGFRFSWSASEVLKTEWRPSVLLDLYHVGSPRRALAYDQVKFRDVDALGNQTNPNPDYGEPLSFQPPMTARLGLVVEF